MDRSELPLVMVAVAILAVLVAGELIVVTSDGSQYSASAAFDGSHLEYEVSAKGSKVYTVVVSDNGGYGDLGRLFIYYDPSYEEDLQEAVVAVGARSLDQEYQLKQIEAALKYRGVTVDGWLDAEGLGRTMDEGFPSDRPDGVIVVSGSLPSTVYSGHSDDKVIGWLEEGGRLFWAGARLGETYSTTERIVAVPGGQSLFLGAECLNPTGVSSALSEVAGGSKEILSLTNNEVLYAVNPSLLSEGRRSTVMGFTDGTYCSIASVSVGKGAVCIYGGDLSNNQRNDIAQTIAMGIVPGTTVVAYDEGTVTRGTVEGSIEVSGTGFRVYIYLGGYYPVYGTSVTL